MESGYCYCSNSWALDKEIKNELGLLLIISSLCAEKGYCYASNEYLADIFHINKTLVSRKLKILEEKQYINITYERRGAEIIGREIRLSKTITDDYRKQQPTIIENDKENNIKINNIKINNKEIYKEKFKKPTIEEVKEYCLERNNNVDPETFVNFYESKGWLVGKVKMKDWKACVRTWEKNSKHIIAKEEKPIPNWFGNSYETTELTEEEQREMEEMLNV